MKDDWDKFNRDFKRRERIILILLGIATLTGVCIPLLALLWRTLS